MFSSKYDEISIINDCSPVMNQEELVKIMSVYRKVLLKNKAQLNLVLVPLGTSVEAMATKERLMNAQSTWPRSDKGPLYDPVVL